MKTMSIDPLERRRLARQATQNRNLIIGAAVAGVALLLVCGTAVGVLWRSGPTGGIVSAVVGPSAAREGETWSLEELVAYLKTKGLAHSHYGGMQATAPPGPYIRIRRTSTDGANDSTFGPGVLFVQRVATATDAKDAALTWTNPELKTKGFSWGRYVFASSDHQYLAAVRGALD